jgi:protein MpaA
LTDRITCSPRLLFTMSMFLIAGLCGCQDPGEIFIVGDAPEIKVEASTNFSAGFSVEKREIEYSVLGTGPDVVMLIATIHGNENAGTSIVRGIEMLLEDSEDILKKHQFIILPVANPDGFHHNIRYNANGVDLNRNFAAHNRLNNKINGKHALSEPESVIIENLITRYKPLRIVVFHEPLNCIDYDGPGLEIANAMSKYTYLPVKKLGGRPGSLGSYAGDTLGIPIITVELTPLAKYLTADQLWEKYANMTLAALLFTDPEGLQSVLQ